MQIATNSWHYKLVQWSSDYSPPSNLCPYARRLAWALVKCLVIALVIMVATAALIAPLMYLANMVITFLPDSWLVRTEEYTAVFMLLTGVGSFLYGVTGVLAAVCAGVFSKEKYMESEWRSKRVAAKYRTKARRQPSILAAWLNDIHNKTCTSLDFVDNYSET